MKKFLFGLSIANLIFAIIGSFQAIRGSQTGFLLLMLFGGLALIFEHIKRMKLYGKEEKWGDFIFPNLITGFIGMTGFFIFSHPNGAFPAFFILGIIVGKMCMLATYQEFRWFHLILYGLLTQMTWEFCNAMSWIETNPLTRVFS